VPSSFTADDLARLPGPSWLDGYRSDAFERFSSGPLPDPSEEVWRYFPLHELDLDHYVPAADPGTTAAAGRALPMPVMVDAAGMARLTDGATVLGTADGWPVTGRLPEVAGRSAPLGGGRTASTVADGVTVGTLADTSDPAGFLDGVLAGSDAFVQLNQAYAPGVLVVDVPAGITLDAPVVVVHTVGPGNGRAPAVFPRLSVRLGDGARAEVVEVTVGGDDTLVVPVTELAVGDRASLAYVSLQLLGSRAWTVGRTAGAVGRDGSLVMFTAGLGGRRCRLRTDVVARGQGASTTLCSTYLGSDDQVHDLRTLQDHAAPRTTSDLLCQGAVAQESRSVYSGLIRVRHGATRSDAMQRNRSLVLGDGAHADSVPNLDIEENDVRCSHASAVGPVDPDQQYYVESRGVAPEDAQRLIVRGFYRDVLARCPVGGARDLLYAEVDRRLAPVLDEVGTDA